MKKYLVTVLCLAALVMSGLAPGIAAAKTLEFGEIYALTGSGSWYGMTMQRGSTVAIDEINAAGGAAGYMFKAVTEDHKSGLTTPAQTAFRKMTSINKVPAVMSSFSAPTLSIMAMARQKKVLVFNGGASSPKLMNIPYLHNTRMLGNEIVPVTLQYLWDQGARTMATIYANQTAPISINDTAVKFWEKLGGKVVNQQRHETGATDFASEASIIKSKNPDVIGVWSTGRDVGYLIKAVRKLGVKAFICGDRAFRRPGEGHRRRLGGLPLRQRVFRRQLVGSLDPEVRGRVQQAVQGQTGYVLGQLLRADLHPQGLGRTGGQGRRRPHGRGPVGKSHLDRTQVQEHLRRLHRLPQGRHL